MAHRCATLVAALVASTLLLTASPPRDSMAAVTVVRSEDYGLSATSGSPPEEIAAALAERLQATVFTVLERDGKPLMEIWFVDELPEPAAGSADPAISYGSIPEGAFLGVMRLLRQHRDFRDQPVPAGTYVLRYLRQPDDGDHAGETTYRDFAVLTPPVASRSPAAQRFDVTLGQALMLNTHPFVWGMWPADYVPAQELPAVAPFEEDWWALKIRLPRIAGDPMTLALVVVGSERTSY